MRPMPETTGSQVNADGALPSAGKGRRTWPHIDHDCLRALYIAFLRAFPPNLILEFWARFPLSLDGIGTLTEKRKFEFLWSEDGRVPWIYFWRIAGALEGFLDRQGLHAQDFLAKAAWRIDGSSIYPGRIWLAHLTPMLPELFQDKDPRSLLLRMIPRLAREFFPGGHFRIREDGAEGGWNTAHVVCDPMDIRPGLASFDFPLWMETLLRKAPEAIGAPAFDEIRMVCDFRKTADILGADCSIQNGTLRIGGRAYGTETDIGAFYLESGLAPGEPGATRRSGIRIHEDYVCPRRRRTVLFRGCLYGAPVYLLSLRYKGAAAPADPLSRIILDIREEQSFSTGDLFSRHAKILDMLEAARFRYHAGSETLFLNGAPFVTGMPARIMRKMLRAFASDGKRRFRFLEFKQDRFVHPHPGASYLETRLKRLAERFEERFPVIRIAFPCRGEFEFRPGCEVELREDGR